MAKLAFAIVTILSIACQEVLGQQKYRESFNLSAGFIRFEKDDVNGFYFSNEYNKPLSRYFIISPSLEFGHGTTGSEYPYSLFNKTSVAGNLIINYSPLSSPVSEARLFLRIGLGPSLRYFSGPSLSDYKIHNNASITIGPHLDQGVPLFNPNEILESHNFITAGGKTILDLGFSTSKRTQMGFNASYALYVRGGPVITSGIQFSYLF